MSHVRVPVDAAGRLVVPKDIRAALGIEGGGELVLSIQDGAMLAMTQMEAVRRVQRLLRESVPEGVSLVEELIADRRQEAARFAAGE